MLHANLDDSSTIKLLTTRTYNGGNITNIALGNVAFTTRTVSGTVANLPAGTEAAYVLAMSAVPESGILQEGRKYMLADVVIDGDNTWSLKVPSDSPASLWFVVQVYDGGTFRYFVTKSASGAAAAPLDINGMTKL
jgi:hypothetical protein